MIEPLEEFSKHFCHFSAALALVFAEEAFFILPNSVRHLLVIESDIANMIKKRYKTYTPHKLFMFMEGITLVLKVEETRVIKRFKPFILGKCRCGCNEDIKIRNKRHQCLMMFKNHHHTRGENNYAWKNGFKNSVYGYLLIRKKNHRFADTEGYIPFHRWVYEIMHQCSLLPWTIVHHRDGRKRHNVWWNLALTDRKGHPSFHTDDMGDRYCIECKSDKTHIRKSTGRPEWHKHPRTGEKYVCKTCYDHIRRVIEREKNPPKPKPIIIKRCSFPNCHTPNGSLSGGKIHWYGDGKGGWLCNRCYKREYAKTGFRSKSFI